MKNKLFKHYQQLVCLTGLAGNTIYLFQAYRIWQTQSSHDVTKIGFIVSFLSTTNWAIYGYLIKDKSLFVANLFGFVSATICLIMIYHFT